MARGEVRRELVVLGFNARATIKVYRTDFLDQDLWCLDDTHYFEPVVLFRLVLLFLPLSHLRLLFCVSLTTSPTYPPILPFLFFSTVFWILYWLSTFHLPLLQDRISTDLHPKTPYLSYYAYQHMSFIFYRLLSVFAAARQSATPERL